ncbi:indolepyruvate ferredoxin oxidoreductase family protein [Sphaerisporangium corydalis]|uniref:Indolepyruvate ferredoxin oxidoreductase family protein n=1 Tax=Sphaerisporangium corydalis TaxID=1441875 RepID=A0ABV9EBI1_9ACTN|nr:indolepyruvate ferredoxin oxidoreductase family protein [Sphaerisporangium corydalis]
MDFRLEDRYGREEGRVHLTGIQALVRLPLDQRRRDRRAGLDTAGFISGYQGSPLGGYDLELGRNRALLDEYGVVHRPGLNEELAATSVGGTQLAATLPGFRHDGVFGIWYGKAPGLDRATDAIRHANLAGTHARGGVLALVGDDPVSKSSTVASASEAALADLLLPILYPADPADILGLGLHGFALSRHSGLWTAMKIVTNVADGSATVDLPSDWPNPVLPEVDYDGRPYRHVPTGRMLTPVPLELERSAHYARLEIARAYGHENRLNRVVTGRPGDTIGLVAAGKTWLDLRQALAILGLGDDELARRGIRLLRLGMPWPLDGRTVREFADGLREIVVVEEKRPFIEQQVKELLYAMPDRPAVLGKTGEDGRTLFAAGGELDPDLIARRLARRLGAEPPPRARREVIPLMPRTPYFCSGCPHNRSTKVPEGSLVGAGIGCHTMVVFMDESQAGEVSGLTQMGGEGAQWIGMAPFLDRDHFVQNIGDGTFLHSGSLAVRAAVAAGSRITFKLLYNSAVAMTGGQRAVGGMPVPEITRLLAAEGVRKIIVTTEDTARYRGVRLAPGAEVWHRDLLLQAQETLAAVDGVTVLVHDQECAAEKRRKRRRGQAETPATRVVVNERVCEGCGDCGAKSNCLSVQPVDTEFGRKTRIHQASCNVDYSCLDGDCPSFLTVTPKPGAQAARAPEPERGWEAGEPPEPETRVPSDVFTMRVTGVGGTGVVTLAQIIAVAATLDGKHVRSLDQTGLAQKGGAVVSDVTISEEPAERSNKIVEGGCDLYLGADLLVAADPANLAVASARRTIAVLSTAEVPTGRMVADPGLAFPEAGPVVRRVVAASRQEHSVVLDAHALAGRLLGDDQYVNLLLLGAAYQAGALPVSAASLERAIGLNGVAVAANVRAFRLGRHVVHTPGGVDPAPAPAAPAAVARPGAEAGELIDLVKAEAGSELERLLAVRVPELVAYQDARYAARYAGVVARVRQAEAAVTDETALTEAVARNLHKLMAYKDEYEVARLCLDPAAGADIEERFGPGAKVRWRLHPPLLRSLGLRRKISLGPWFRPVFRLLYAMRRLRGTPVDPFGRAHVRRVERELVEEYAAAVEACAAGLTTGSYERAVELAGLPDLVRGYEQVKLASVARYRERLATLGEEHAPEARSQA